MAPMSKHATKPIIWAYGLTTIPSRFNTTLPRTLRSLSIAGFDNPWLFIDGCPDSEVPSHLVKYQRTCRSPAIKLYGNWLLGMAELYMRNRSATHFVMFQDDLVCSKNLKRFLERVKLPERGYYNLFTFHYNEVVVRGMVPGWYEAQGLNAGVVYHGKMQQSGKGAVALMFTKAGVQALITHHHMLMHALDENKWWCLVDGGIVQAMNMAGYREYVYTPSLVQHTGIVSSIGGKGNRVAKTFAGENFDLLELL
jgi:hypothetical protein